MDAEHLDLERTLAVLRRRWWVIVLITILVGGASFAFSARKTKEYTATTPVVFTDEQIQQEASGLQATQNGSAATQVMATNVQLLTQQAGVAAATAHIVGHGLTAADVIHAISVTQQGQTNVAEVSATMTDPRLAAAVADTYSAQFITTQAAQQRAAVQQGLDLVQGQIAALSSGQQASTQGQALLDRAESMRILATLQDGGAKIVRPATVPRSPSSPKTLRNTALGLLLGLVLGLGTAFLLERLDRSIKSVDELEAAYRLPLLAAVPKRKSFALPPHLDSGPPRQDTEVFKLLRAYLRYFNVDRELKTLVVVSASPGDGKSTIARNLAEAAQETGTKTLLLEADLRRPGFAKHYGLPTGPGLSELLSGSVEVDDAIRSVPIASRVNGASSQVSLHVLMAGHLPPNPAELIASHAMADLLSWTSTHFDLVVIDTPPIAVVSDAISLLREVDGVVLVSQLGKNTRDAARFLRRRLVGVGAPLLGVVANGVKTRASSDYSYGYGSYPHAGDTETLGSEEISADSTPASQGESSRVTLDRDP